MAKFTIEIPDEDVAALRAGIANGGILPRGGVDIGKQVRARAYAQIVGQVRDGAVTHVHAPSELIARTPEETRSAFAELRGALETER